ncbi:MAG TPA: hypothetical protein VN285_08750 [Candidatus Deferrimicrobium sp.]|nr:hypothetical protein [Candidatus Deferrimicrobium sp.]
MNDEVSWLPSLVFLSAFDGDWERYVEQLYTYFKQDFVYSPPFFRGQRIGLKRFPITKGKEATFWHLISTGTKEHYRYPDLRRCERIRWPRAIIENAEDSVVKTWENIRNGERRQLLWLEQHEYLVILARRAGYALLWTAYLVDTSHQRRKLQQEFEEFHH